MSQLSKTAGRLWATMAGEVDEHVILSEFAAFSGLILAQAESLIFEKNRFADKINELTKDRDELKKLAQKAIQLSQRRDSTVSAVKYPTIISSVLENLQNVLVIAVRWNLVEFDESTRFSSYLEDK